MSKRSERLAIRLHALGWTLAGLWVGVGLILALTTKWEITETVGIPGWILVVAAIVAALWWVWQFRNSLERPPRRISGIYDDLQVWYGGHSFERRTQRRLLIELAGVVFLLTLASVVGYDRLGALAFLARWAVILVICLIFFSRAYLLRPVVSSGSASKKKK